MHAPKRSSFLGGSLCAHRHRCRQGAPPDAPPRSAPRPPHHGQALQLRHVSLHIGICTHNHPFISPQNSGATHSSKCTCLPSTALQEDARTGRKEIGIKEVLAVSKHVRRVHVTRLALTALRGSQRTRRRKSLRTHRLGIAAAGARHAPNV